MAALLALVFTAVSAPARAADSPSLPIDGALVQRIGAPVEPAALEVRAWPEVFAMLRERSTDLHISDQQVEVGRGQRTSALGRDLPHLLAVATARRDLLSGRVCDQISLNCVDDVTAYAASLSVVQRVLDPSGWAAIQGANRALEAHRFDAVDKRRVLTLATADAIARVMLQERLADSGRVAVKDSVERRELVRHAVTLGSLPAAEAVRADQDLAVALRAVVETDDALLRAREALGALLGQDGGVGVRADFDLRALGHACQSGAPAARADVSARRMAAEAASSDVSRIGWLLAPVVDFVSAFTVSSIPFVDDRHRSLVVGGNLTLPLWEGTQRWGELRAARARAAQAREELTGTSRLASLEQEEASRRLALALAAVQVAREGQRLAADAERLSRAALTIGSSTALELIDSGRRLRDSQANLVSREIELLATDVRNQLVSARCNW